jgi:hypothetical protein
MSIKTASEALEAMLNQDDFRHRVAWEQFMSLLQEMSAAVAEGDNHQIKVVSGKVSGYTRLRLATARGWLTDDIMRELDITPTQTLGVQIMKLAFGKGLTISTANKSWALPGRTAKTKLAPEGQRKVEDNLDLVKQYSKLYERHEVRLRAKVSALIAEAKKARRREKVEASSEPAKPKKLPRDQSKLFI